MNFDSASILRMVNRISIYCKCHCHHHRHPRADSMEFPGSLAMSPYSPSFLAGPLDWIQCPRWVAACKFLLVGQLWCVQRPGSNGSIRKLPLLIYKGGVSWWGKNNHRKIALIINVSKSKVGDPKAPFSIATTPRCREEATAFSELLLFTLDPYLIMLRVKQGGIKYHFLSTLIRLDLGLNAGLPGHWLTRYPFGQCYLL